MTPHLRSAALLTGLLLLPLLGMSQDAASPVLAQAARLEAEKKYESAYQVLNKADPKDQ